METATQKLSTEERARARIAHLKAQAQAIEARLQKKERARDTRCKVLAGAAMIGLARKDPAIASVLLQALRTLEPKDQLAVTDLVRELSPPAPAINLVQKSPQPAPAPAEPNTSRHQVIDI
jgi:hypothetical protein